MTDEARARRNRARRLARRAAKRRAFRLRLLHLAYVHDLSVAGIAAIVGCSTRRVRAILRMRDRLWRAARHRQRVPMRDELIAAFCTEVEIASIFSRHAESTIARAFHIEIGVRYVRACIAVLRDSGDLPHAVSEWRESGTLERLIDQLSALSGVDLREASEWPQTVH